MASRNGKQLLGVIHYADACGRDSPFTIHNLIWPMTFEQFQQSLSQSSPPSAISRHLESLWYDAKGDWEQSHNIIQDINDRNASWIHAYLHRKEGDLWNADYWYNRAGKKRPSITLDEEWEGIVRQIV